MPHILFLMSDTGGGHRAACRSIEAALQIKHPGEFTVELVDMWKEYTPFPMNKMPEAYGPWINRSPGTYEAQYWVNDRIFKNWTFSRIYAETSYRNMQRMYTEHPADLIVCVHSVFVRPAVYALRKMKLNKPFVTVITDYAWPVVLWYDPWVDRCLVPTIPAYERGLSLGMQPSQMVLTGAPVHPRFTDLKITKAEARQLLGWSPNARIAMLIGGGDGMGPLVDTARAIDQHELDSELVIIAGKNTTLKAALEAINWKRPTRIYGFVNNIEVFMRAADVLITKAGPATITEAATVGLPMILSGAIQYQESPNVDYVVQHGAGVYAPGPDRVADNLTQLLANGGAGLEKLAIDVQKIAEPHAIWKIADEIWKYA